MKSEMRAMLLALLIAALLSPRQPLVAAAGKCREECGSVKIPYPLIVALLLHESRPYNWTLQEPIYK